MLSKNIIAKYLKILKISKLEKLKGICIKIYKKIWRKDIQEFFQKTIYIK